MKFFSQFRNGYLLSLRVGMSIVFLTLFAISTLLIILFTSISFSRALTYLSRDLMNSASISINRELSTILTPTISSVTLSSWLIQDNIVNPKNFFEMIEYTEDLLQVLPQAEYVSWGDKKGNYIGAYREPNDTISTELVYSQTVPPQHLVLYRDKFDRVIRTEKKIYDYDPRVRPWYLRAKLYNKPIWTNVYRFSFNHKMGLTAAAPTFINNKFVGVFGIDLELGSLSNFLKQHPISKHGIALILNQEGDVIAYPNMGSSSQQNARNSMNLPNINSLEWPFIYKAFQIFKQTNRAKFSFHFNNNIYLASFVRINELPDDHWYIAIIVPQKDFIGELEHYNKIIMLILVIISILGLLTISLFAKRISIPINKLANHLEEIKFFHIEKILPIKTRIKEVFIMSQAIQSMKTGLESFRKYVPENLVRQLIYSGQAAKIGGVHRNIVLFFTDVVNFSATAEQVGPEKIMVYLCDYFEELTRIISENKGTVDKYMGDSIMAFWGAPLTDEKGIQHACSAALQCQKRLDQQNIKWQQAKRIVFPTRIGLHFGDVTIGNLGSSERLNYTAIGDSVNIASRLEQLNKYYGTKILVSDFIRNKMHELFLFRIIDRVIVKGRKEPITIYELIQEGIENVPENIQILCEFYQKGFTAYQHEAWDEAILYFEKCLKANAQDFASQVMINRCFNLKENPPPDNWSGIWIFTTKK